MEHAIDSQTHSAAKIEALGLLKPVAASERIAALDVIRGFALIGIFFMNVEWFNRSFADFSLGIPVGVSGLDWWAHYFVNFFVAGKFWTIFSLLFGMGFALMLGRAEETGRAFLLPYIRRIIGLAIFGILHTVLVWPGDILYSYAFTAAGLLIVLFGRWQWIVLSILLMLGLSAIPKMGESFGSLAAMIGLMGVLALFIRNERRFKILGFTVPLFSLILLIGLCLLLLAVGATWLIPAMLAARTGLIVAASLVGVTAVLTTIFHQPASDRTWRISVLLYCMPFLTMLVFGVIDYQKPLTNVFHNQAAVKLAAEKMIAKAEKEKVEAAAKLDKGKAEAKESVKKADDNAKPKTEAEKKLEEAADRINNIQNRQKEAREDVVLLKTGSYTEVARHRLKEFLEGPTRAGGLAFSGIAMFLIGLWFVRAGIMAKTANHLAFFRKLAAFGLPLGLGLSVIASSIAVSHVRGVDGDGWQLKDALLNLGNLPTCLAYVSLIVLMLHSNSIFSKIKVLAPFGRMALTNYLTQSLIQASFFYGWGLGNFGMGRAQQLGFAVIVIALQIVFSHWWLSKFRYGPMEWVWRAITYWQIPKLKIE
ncbi:MAG: DUF418 domain-containing protein, partial [Undibacterium sp.]|nr:DUF418 domain-containing protein [Undibacterium sp.]